MHVTIYDKDMLGSDFLCGVTIPLFILADQQPHTDWWNLTTDNNFLRSSSKSRLSTADISSNKQAIVSPQVKNPTNVKGRILLQLRWESKFDQTAEFTASKMFASMSRLDYHSKKFRSFNRSYKSLQQWESVPKSLSCLLLWMTLCNYVWAFPLSIHLIFLLFMFWRYVIYKYSQSPALALILADEAASDDESENEEDIQKNIFFDVAQSASPEAKAYLLKVQEHLDDALSLLDDLEDLFTWKDPKRTMRVIVLTNCSLVMHCFVSAKYSLMVVIVGYLMSRIKNRNIVE
jgi:hypothetical protein